MNKDRPLLFLICIILSTLAIVFTKAIILVLEHISRANTHYFNWWMMIISALIGSVVLYILMSGGDFVDPQ